MSDVDVEEEPTAAYWCSLIGGVLGLIVGFVVMMVGASVASLVGFSGVSVGLSTGVGLWDMITAVVVMVSAYNLHSDPWEHTKWGVIIIIFSVIGLGTILGLVGGILAVVYKPEESVPYQPSTPPMATITRICPKCGRVLNEQVKFCPYCGNELA